MTEAEKCIRPQCGKSFEPLHKHHIFCSDGCWTAILHEEIGVQAAGMRPLGMMGDRKKIAAVTKKYDRLARLERINP